MDPYQVGQALGTFLIPALVGVVVGVIVYRKVGPPLDDLEIHPELKHKRKVRALIVGMVAFVLFLAMIGIGRREIARKAGRPGAASK